MHDCIFMSLYTSDIKKWFAIAFVISATSLHSVDPVCDNGGYRKNSASTVPMPGRISSGSLTERPFSYFLNYFLFSLSLLCRDRNEGQHLCRTYYPRPKRSDDSRNFRLELFFIIHIGFHFILYRLFRRGSLVIDRSFRQIDDISRNVSSNRSVTNSRVAAFVIKNTSFGFYFHLFVFLFTPMFRYFYCAFFARHRRN